MARLFAAGRIPPRTQTLPMRYYEINVSHNGVHYFATADRSLTTREAAYAMYHHFTDAFPARDGYELEVRYCESLGIKGAAVCRLVEFESPTGQPIR